MNTAVIPRGIPGSGKSTLTNLLMELASKNNFSFSVHSTDALLYVNGVYTFVPEKMGYMHNLNYQNFQKSVDDGVNLIVVDNTNIMPKDFMRYVDYAKGKGYRIAEARFHPDSLEEHTKRNVHSVPAEAVQRMYERFQNTFDKDFAYVRLEIKPATYMADIEKAAGHILELTAHK